MMTGKEFRIRAGAAVKRCLPSTRRTALWMIKITVAVSFCIMLLGHFGVIEWISEALSPVFVPVVHHARNQIARRFEVCLCLNYKLELLRLAALVCGLRAYFKQPVRNAANRTGRLHLRSFAALSQAARPHRPDIGERQTRRRKRKQKQKYSAHINYSIL